MNGRDLFHDLSYIDPQLVEEASRLVEKKKIRSFAAIAACLCVLVCAGVLFSQLFGGRSSTSGTSGSTGTFMSYAGPVLPLTAQEAAEDIVCTRNVIYDFKCFRTVEKTFTEAGGESTSYSYWDSRIAVTDEYKLENAGEEQTLTLLYPYIGTLREMDLTPQITVDGIEVDTELYVGPYSGGFTKDTG